MTKPQNANLVETAVENQNENQRPNITSKEVKKLKIESQKEIQTIFRFLLDCSQYEADALRVMVQLSRNNDPQAALSKDDSLAVNRFLNYGLNKNNPTLDEIRNHRHTRADVLMNSVARFVCKEEMIRIMQFLYGFAINAKDVEEVFKFRQTHEQPNKSQLSTTINLNTETGK